MTTAAPDPDPRFPVVLDEDLPDDFDPDALGMDEADEDFENDGLVEADDE